MIALHVNLNSEDGENAVAVPVHQNNPKSGSDGILLLDRLDDCCLIPRICAHICTSAGTTLTLSLRSNVVCIPNKENHRLGLLAIEKILN